MSFELPKNKDERVAALNHLRDAANASVNLYRVRWLISHYWLQGIRSLYPDFLTGTVEYHLRNQQDPAGNLQLVYEDVVVKRQEEIGRIGRMDVGPATKAKGHGLDRIRKAAAGRVILEYLSSNALTDKDKATIFNIYVDYGTVGIMLSTHSDQYPGLQESEESGAAPIPVVTENLKAYIQPVPPWELYPIPANPDVPTDVRGILRRRWVPLSWLKKQKGLSFPQNNEELQVRTSSYGEKPRDVNAFGFSSLQGDASAIQRPMEEPNPSTKAGGHLTEFVQLEEYFMFHEERDRLCRWIVKAGNRLLREEYYEDRSVFCPLATAAYHPVAGFYGRSFVELLIPIASEVEQMAANLFQNVKDMDTFGLLMMPNSLGVSKNELLRKDRKRRVIFFEPDPTLESRDKPFAIEPVTSSDTPGKIMSFGNQLIDRLTRQSDLMRGEAPGRVDSAQGLGFLNEMANIPLSVPANGIADAFTQIYKALLAAAPSLLSETQEIPLLGLDDASIGLVLKPDAGAVTLNPSAFPLASEVEIGIKDKLPAPPAIRINQLKEALQMQLITPLELKITVWRENLDYPVGSWAQQEAYRKTVLQCLLLFGDGETPGQVIVNTESDQPDVALAVLGAFMAKVEFSFAGPKVRQTFEDLKRTYQGMLGQGYPAQMGYPEDEAAMQQQMMSQMGSPGGPPGGGPPQMGPPQQ